MDENVARRPRFRRVADSLPLRLTDRDRAVLSVVCRFRFLATSQILSLIPGSHQNLRRRLQLLYHAGFLDRPEAQMPLRSAGELSEIVYSPSEKTLSLLGRFSSESRRVTSLFLSHALAISTILVTIEIARRRHGAPLFSEEDILSRKPTETRRRIQWRVPLTSAGVTERVGVLPDAVFAIEDQERLFYFVLEADRGTMPLQRKNLRLSSIHRKALAYSQTRKTGILKDQFDIPGFQVVFVTKSKERLERMRETCRDALDGNASSLFLFLTYDDLQTQAWYNTTHPLHVLRATHVNNP